MNRPHALYRFRDADGVLLYVGITHDPGQRWPAHMRDKPWWTQVATIELEPYPDRPSVLAAERDAIRVERPLHNVVHNGKAREPRRPDSSKGWGVHWSHMPDLCHDYCAPAGDSSIYYPYQWVDGLGHYLCARGHRWTCAWGHSASGEAPQKAGQADGQVWRKPPTAESPPMLPEGSVVVLALQNSQRVPVGLVRSSDQRIATLDLYSWLTGYFGHDEIEVEYRHIRCLRFAERGPDGVFEMDALADFQREWEQVNRPLSRAEQRHIERVLAIPGHVGRVL